MMASPRRTPLAHQVADDLVARIRDGEWEVGERLPGEMRLAADLGVGRSTIREAVRQLVGRGMLSSRQGAGVFLVSREGGGSWETALRDANIVAVVEARMAIEVEAAALAARRRTTDDVRTIRRALEERGRRRSGGIDLVDVDMTLHRSIVAAAHNTVLLGLFDGFVLRMREAMIDVVQARPDFDRDEDHALHVDLVEAIVAGDDAAAAHLARSHLRSLRERFDPSSG